MYVYRLDTTDPRLNMAIEEVCYNYWDQDEPLLLLWQNSDAIVVGKHQNIHEEINVAYAKEHDVAIIRRISGGGTVYHDMGNINYSLILSNSKDIAVDVEAMEKPIVLALRGMGLAVESSKRHDLRIDGKKVSGTAQAKRKGQLLHHGTLLYDSDLPKLKKALTVRKEKIHSRGVQSVSSHVTNIADHLDESMTVNHFIEAFIQSLRKGYVVKEWKLPNCLIPEVIALKDEKYSDWSWNFGKSKYYRFVELKQFPKGYLTMEVTLDKSLIQEIHFDCEWLMMEALKHLEKTLRGIPYDEKVINDRLYAIMTV